MGAISEDGTFAIGFSDQDTITLYTSGADQPIALRSRFANDCAADLQFTGNRVVYDAENCS